MFEDDFDTSLVGNPWPLGPKPLSPEKKRLIHELAKTLKGKKVKIEPRKKRTD